MSQAASQTQQQALELTTDLPIARAPSKAIGRILWLEAAILLTLVQVLFAGYRMGVGNQTIQIPFLKQWSNPSLYSNDPMVSQTLANYPSFFFRGLSVLANFVDVPLLYFVLHLLTAFAVLMATYWLGRTIFKDRLAGAIAALLLFAGHQRALAGDEMYSMGFTHTWAVFPLAILAMVFLYREWHLAAFALAGIIFNLHALTGAYLAVMFGFWAVLESRTLGWKKVGVMVGTFVFLALPTVVLMARHRQTFDAGWLEVTKIRSADHSFASSWWQSGTPDIPRFALLLGFAALSMSFRPRGRQLRKSLLMAAAVGILFIFGYVFSDIRPVPLILRAQLFRASRLLLVLMFVHIAFSIAASFQIGLKSVGKREDEPEEAEIPKVSKPGAILEMISAGFTLICLAVPGLLPFWPIALVLGGIVALVNGRLSWIQTSVVGAALLVTLAAWHTIEYPIAGLGAGMTAKSLLAAWPNAGGLFWIGLIAGVGIWAISRVQLDWWMRLAIVAMGILVTALLSKAAYVNLVRDTLASDTWVAAQEWAKQNTPVGSVFLTPDRPGGFRIHSERPVVCEWRDGTQAYFSASYGKQWLETLKQLRPGILYDASGERRLSDGQSLESLPDYKIIDLSKAPSIGAQYVVLPTIPKERNLKLVYQNVGENGKGGWSIYETKPQFPPGVVDKALWLDQERFIKEVALPNIEKYRKSDAKVVLLDANGQPLQYAQYKLKQTRQAFKWGCSLPFFEQVEGEPMSDYKPDPVTPQELSRFLEIFNYTLIPYSSKWMYLEPEEGRRNFHELDMYVDWCVKHNIEMEFHYITGLQPTWLRRKPTSEQEQILLRHAADLVDRYGDRIKRWQVVNDKYLLSESPPVFEAIRKSHPDLKLGTSDCAKFYSYAGNRIMDQYRGLEDLEWLKKQGVKPDFFGIHGHTPHGLWPDVNVMYDVFDKFAAAGVRLEVTEFLLPLNQISGPVRRGVMWTPELQAEFFETYYTICFSHPAVDGINYWVLGQGLEYGTGLVDPDNNFAPRPTFNMLKELITKRWRTPDKSGSTSGDGSVAFRGFHGDFEVEVTLANGNTAKASFAVKPNSENSYRMKLNSSGGFDVVP